MNVKIEYRIKDVEEFSKIFKINIPIKEYFDYYIRTLSKSQEFMNINELVNAFSDLEKYAKSLGYSGAKSYKLDFALPTLVNYIKQTEAYKNVQEYTFKSVTKDMIKKNGEEDCIYISFDISKANYSTIKQFDEYNELMGSWEELCNHFDIHPTLIKSKSFRQIVFGNLNPNRLQKFQHFNIMNALNLLKLRGVSEDNIAFISHDELVLKFKENDPNEAWIMNQYLSNDIIDILSKEMNDFPVKRTVYKLKRLGKEMYVKYVLNRNLELDYKTLHAVPGNKFYKYFKTQILEEQVEDMDLKFYNDGEIAKWAENEDSIAETIAPEGEMSMSEIENLYPYFVKKLKEGLPSLNDAQIRKIINISLSVCTHCYNDNHKCKCWRDE